MVYSSYFSADICLWKLGFSGIQENNTISGMLMKYNVIGIEINKILNNMKVIN